MKKVSKEKLLELANGDEWIKLEEIVLKNPTEIINLVKRSVFSREGTHLLSNILKSLQCKTDASTSLKHKIYEAILSLIKCNEDTDEKENGKVVADLLLHVESFPSDVHIKLINSYLEHLEAGLPFYGRWVELLGKLLTTAFSQENLMIDGKAMCGEDYQYHILKTLCGYEWSAKTTTTLLPIIKELKLSKEELKDVIEKLKKVLREVDYQSVPPIVYHMILVCQDSLPGTVLEVVVEFFNEQEEALKKRETEQDSSGIGDAFESERIEKNSMCELLEAQGTVIFHMTHLAQYDHHLFKEYLKVTKGAWGPQKLFAPFNLALALSLSQIDRYKDQIMDSLKSAILKHFKQEEKVSKSLWLSEAFKSDLQLGQVFRTTVNNCKEGWDQVSEGMVCLCFNILESGGALKAESFQFQQARSVAGSVLPLIFKRQPALGTDIIKQLSVLIFTVASSGQYVDLLARLVKVSPLTLLDNVHLVRDLLEQVAFLPPHSSVALFNALLPLIKMSMMLKDALVMILRKMLFSKQVENRCVSVSGFLLILRHFRVLGALPSSQASMSFSSTLSQVSADIHTSFDANTNEALCLELLGVLRRCFAQQAQVRSTLYGGLFDVCRANPKIAPSILQFLQQHLCAFVDENPEALNPIRLLKAVSVRGDTVTLIEPLGELLGCVSRCKTWFESYRSGNAAGQEEEDEEEVVQLLNKLCSTFDVLTEKLAYCDMDDLGLANVSFIQGTTSGKQNLHYAEIMTGVFDALIDHNFSNDALNSEQQMKKVLTLFKTQKKIVELVKEKSKPAKKGEGSKGKGRPASAKQTVSFRSVLSLEVAVKILKVALDADPSADPSCVAVLKDNADIQLYVIAVVEQNNAALKAMQPSQRERLLPHLKAVGNLLYKECLGNLAQEEDGDEREITRVRHCLTTFHSLLVSFVNFYKDKLPQIFKELTGKSATKEYELLLHSVAKSCCKMVLKIVGSDNQKEFTKEVLLLLQIIGLVAQQMDQKANQLAEVQDFLNQICKDQPIANAGVAESLIKLLLSVTDRVKTNNNIVRSLAREIHFRMGDIEEGIDLDESGNYKIVTESSAATILIALCHYCDDVLVNLTLTLNKLKSCLISGEKCDEKQLNKMISLKFVVIIHTLHEVLQSAIPHGSCQSILIKTTYRFYDCISLYVKYYLHYYRIKNKPEMSENFEKVIHLCANMLKDHVFKVIVYVHSTQAKTQKVSQNSLTARILEESRVIPSLVYSMEQYETHLVKLSKKSKVNLMVGTKMATSRDFRIIADALQNAIPEQEAEAESEEGEEQEQEDEVEEQEEERERKGREVHLRKEKRVHHQRGKEKRKKIS